MGGEVREPEREERIRRPIALYPEEPLAHDLYVVVSVGYRKDGDDDRNA